MTSTRLFMLMLFISAQLFLLSFIFYRINWYLDEPFYYSQIIWATAVSLIVGGVIFLLNFIRHQRRRRDYEQRRRETREFIRQPGVAHAIVGAVCKAEEDGRMFEPIDVDLPDGSAMKLKYEGGVTIVQS